MLKNIWIWKNCQRTRVKPTNSSIFKIFNAEIISLQNKCGIAYKIRNIWQNNLKLKKTNPKRWRAMIFIVKIPQNSMWIGVKLWKNDKIKLKKLSKSRGVNNSSYLRAQPRRQSEREMSPTRNPFPVQAKKREIPGIKKKSKSKYVFKFHCTLWFSHYSMNSKSAA